MKPAAGGIIDVFGDVGGERDDVVVEGFLQLFRALDAESGARRHNFKIFFRDRAFLDESLAGEELDLQPDFELALFCPDLAHWRARIALNHVWIKPESEANFQRSTCEFQCSTQHKIRPHPGPLPQEREGVSQVELNA